MAITKFKGRGKVVFPRHSKRAQDTNTTQTKLGIQGRHPVSLPQYCIAGVFFFLVLGALYRKATKSSTSSKASKASTSSKASTEVANRLTTKKNILATIKSRNGTIMVDNAAIVKQLRRTRNDIGNLDDEPHQDLLAKEPPPRVYEINVNNINTMANTKLNGFQGQRQYLPMFLHEYLLVAIYLTLIIGGLSRLVEVFLPVFIR